MTYVVFKNLKDGDYLPDYDASDEALKFRERFHPHHVVMPRLDEEYVTELERLDLTIADVLQASDGVSPRGRNIGPLLSQLMVRARLRRFQQNIYAQFDPIFRAIGLLEARTGFRKHYFGKIAGQILGSYYALCDEGRNWGPRTALWHHVPRWHVVLR